MLPQFENAARGALQSRGASNIRVSGTSIKEVVQTLFAEEMAKLKKVRLTWNPGQAPEPPDPSMKIGLLCKWKPYTGPIGIGRYFVQNMMVLYSNGEPVEDMSTISTEKRVERIVDGKGNFLREHTFKSDREYVDEALRFYMQIAIRLDPNLCRYCVQFSTDNRDEYILHMRQKHKPEFYKMLHADDPEVIPDPAPEEPEPEPPTEPPPTEPGPEPVQPESRKARAARAS